MRPPPRQLVPAARRRQRFDRAALALIALGAAFRIQLAATLPVGYDEVFVMGLGLDAMQASAGAALIDIPITRSTAVTPLWWWVQYLPVAVLGDVSLSGMRVIPVGLGVATLFIAWRCARARFGRRVGLVVVAFVSLSDILIFTNSRGEFAESLTVPLIIVLACQAGRYGRTIMRGFACGLVLLTALVKGILVAVLVSLAECAVTLRASPPRLRRVCACAVSLLIATVPTLAYLIWADAHLAGEPIHHDAMEASDLGMLIHGLVFDYARLKAHVTGTLRDAAIVALDFVVWPVTALTAPVLTMAGVWGIAGTLRGGLGSNGRRAAARTGLTAWVLIGAAVVLGRGTLGARYHLMYLPAAWLLAALWLSSRRPVVHRGTVAGACVLWAVWVGLARSWTDWTNCKLDADRWLLTGATLIAGLGLLIWLARRRNPIAPVAFTAAILVAAVALCVAGPNGWAPISRFEPIPRGEVLALLDAARSGRTVPAVPLNHTFYFDMYDYYVNAAPNTSENLARGLHFARLEVRRVPDDARAWACLGEALYRNRSDLAEVRRAWQRSYELAPNATVADWIAQVDEAIRATPTP